MQRESEDAGRVLIEAFHTIYHPATIRARDIVRSGVIGAVADVQVVHLGDFLRGRTSKDDDVRLDVTVRRRAELKDGTEWMVRGPRQLRPSETQRRVASTPRPQRGRLAGRDGFVPPSPTDGSHRRRGYGVDGS